MQDISDVSVLLSSHILIFFLRICLLQINSRFIKEFVVKIIFFTIWDILHNAICNYNFYY